MTVTLTLEQSRVVSEITRWFKNKLRPVFSVAGYAGVGKSTLVAHAVESIGLSNDQVRYLAFTGKAALVLLRKGLPAQTIHSFVYVPKLKTYRDPVTKLLKKKVIGFTLGFEARIGVKLLVIDEVSMVSERILNDVLALRIPLLVLGDPGQLPPVMGVSNQFLVKPDSFLSTIHRQAAGSPIIQLAQDVRLGAPLSVGVYGADVNIIRFRDLQIDDLIGHHQVLTCLHRNRKMMNKRIREFLGFGVLPEMSDKLVCMKNNADIVSTQTFTPLVNGLLAVVSKPLRDVSRNLRSFIMDVDVDGVSGDMYLDVPTNLDFFEPHGDLAPDTDGDITHWDYGYAITVHRSQGSEWDSVLVIADLWGDTVTQRQLLYTAVTRASKKLTIAL